MTKARKYWQFLFIPGLILLVAGLVAGLVSGWLPLHIGLAVAGGVILVLWLGLLLSASRGFWGRRSTQAGTNALVATGAVILILGLINFLAVRYSQRIDLTENQLFTLSSGSQQLVQNLSQPLKVWIFERNINPADQKLLENYQRNGPIQFEVVDPQVNLGLAQQFNVQSVGEVYLEYGDKKQLVQTLSQTERLSEIRLSNAIAQIQSDRTLSLYILQGHGEPELQATEGGLSQAVAGLEGQGYQVEALNLAERSDVPEDAAAIIVAGPKRKLFAGEVTALKNYLNSGGRLLLLIDPETDPGLEPLLQDWGVELDPRLIIDASGTGDVIGYGPATTLITNYGDHPVTEEFANGISVYPLARPIGTVKKQGIEAVALLITGDRSWAESNLQEEEVAFDPQSDVEGPLDLGVVLTRPSATAAADGPDNNSETESRLVVIGNSAFATNGWFEQQLNGDVFLNSVDWLANDEEQTLAIRPKEPNERRINLSAAQAGMIGWLALLVMPLLGLIAAAIAWWRRR